jgi:hypothetical protein
MYLGPMSSFSLPVVILTCKYKIKISEVKWVELRHKSGTVLADQSFKILCAVIVESENFDLSGIL